MNSFYPKAKEAYELLENGRMQIGGLKFVLQQKHVLCKEPPCVL